MTIPRLSSILFEENDAKQAKTLTAYEPPAFALFEPNQYSLVLVNVPGFMNLLKTGKDVTMTSLYQACAGVIDMGEPPTPCLGSLQVRVVGSSPTYPGAGTTMYKLAYSHYGRPLTSDRQHSTSVAARETWAKIEKNPEWKKVSDLDNYAELDNDKVYATFNDKSFPQRDVIKWRPEPNTPDPKDDCVLPSKYGEIKTMSDMADVLGTTAAYEYTGPVNAAPLIKHGQDLLNWITSRGKAVNPEGVPPVELIEKLAVMLFKTRYKGVGTTR